MTIVRRSFWMASLDALHPSVRERYAPYFHRAERWERTLDDALALWRELRRFASWLLFRAARIMHPDLR
jgi:hypothetical protein